MTKPDQPLRVAIWQAASTKAQTVETKAEWDKQQEDGRRWAEANGGRVVEIFSVPGHSRRFFSLEKLAVAAEKKDITAFTRLLAEFDHPTIQVIWCRGADRWARTQSLFARMVEELITAGIAIYSQEDEMLIKSMKQARRWISDAGARVATDVDKLMDYRHTGMNEYMKRGLPTNSTPPRSHQVRRNPVNGKAEALVVNPRYRVVYEDAAKLLLEGIAYRRLERELLKRFGHGKPDGTPLAMAHIWDIFSNPITWGNVARFHTQKHGESRTYVREMGDWIFESGHPLPDGVEIAYGVCEPLFKGELAARVKSEMQRRWRTSKGSGLRTGLTLSGLLYCADCQRAMTYTWSGDQRSLRCNSHWRNIDNPTYPDCEQRIRIREEAVIEWLKSALEEAIDGVPDTLFAATSEKKAKEGTDAETLQNEIGDLTGQIGRLIDAQKTVDNDLFNDYQQQIIMLNTRRKHKTELLRTAREEETKTLRSSEQASHVLDSIRAEGSASLWLKPPQEINQVLHTLMQNTVLLVHDGKIVDRGERSKL